MARGPIHLFNIGVPLLSTLTDPSVKPSSSITLPVAPSYTQETTNTQRIGRYECPGKHIAIAARRLSLAYIACNFDREFIPGDNGSSI